MTTFSPKTRDFNRFRKNLEWKFLNFLVINLVVFGINYSSKKKSGIFPLVALAILSGRLVKHFNSRSLR